ncbi:MAG: HNH endonuclease signature motif containing protein [Ktedonobacteraceae bacterium]
MAFHGDKRKTDGRTSTCKDCVNAGRRKKREENLEVVRAYHREYQNAHAEKLNERNRIRYQEDEEKRQKKSSYYFKNADKIKQQRKVHQKKHAQRIQQYKQGRYQKFADYFKKQKQQYYQDNTELIKNRKRNYRTADPERYAIADKAKFARRRTRKTLAGGKFTAQEWLALNEKYSFSCLCCGRKEPDIKLTADHVVPVAKGGSSDISNIQPLCLSCNSKKHSKIVDYRTGESNDK